MCEDCLKLHSSLSSKPLDPYIMYSLKKLKEQLDSKFRARFHHLNQKIIYDAADTIGLFIGS